MITIFLNVGRRLHSRLHPPAKLVAVELRPDFEKSAARGSGSRSLVFEQCRGSHHQSGIVGVLLECALELSQRDQGLVVRRERPAPVLSVG
jgi:hypothetical protein